MFYLIVMNSSAMIRANMNFYLAECQILRNDIERQDYKLESYVKALDRYRQVGGERQPTIFDDGLGRSGFMKLITSSDRQVSQIHAIHQADEVTTHWKEGDLYMPSSGSGKNLPILNKAVRCVEDNILLGCMTSSEDKPLAKIVREQLEGVQSFEVKTGKSSFSYGGFKKTSEEIEKFRKAYNWISNPEDFSIIVSGREQVVGDFDEKTGLSPGGNWYEWGTRFVDDVITISYNEWVKLKEKMNLKDELKNWAYKYSESVRLSLPKITDQINTLNNVAEDISSKEVEQTIISAVGERSGIEGKSLRMRAGHAGFHLPEKKVIHIDSINKPRLKAEVEAQSEDYRNKNVRGIVISHSLATDSKETAEWFDALKIPYWLFTQNTKCNIATRQKNKGRLIELPEPTLNYAVRENPGYYIPPLIGMMTLDSIGAAILGIKDRTISEVHPVD
jgi:hypothetical protein